MIGTPAATGQGSPYRNRARIQSWRVPVLLGVLLASSTVAATTGANATAPDGAAPAQSCPIPPADVIPPQLTSISLTTHSVNVTDSPASVGITAHAVDTSGTGSPSGVASLLMTWLAPNGHDFTLTLHRVGGTAADGDWRASQTFYAQQAHGTWILAGAELEDGAGNQYQYGHLPGEPYQAYDPMPDRATDSVDVEASGPARYQSGQPRLTGLSLNKTHVNATRHLARLTFTARTESSLPLRGVTLRLIPPVFERDGYFPVPAGRAHRVSGSPGRWKGTVTLSRWLGHRTALTARVSLVAQDPKHRRMSVDYDGGALREMDLPHRVIVTSGPLDWKGPTISGFSVSKTHVDAANGPTTVRYTARGVHDNISGPASMSIRYGGDFPGTPMHRTRHQTWTGTLVIPRCSPPRVFNPGLLTTYDRAGNVSYHRTAVYARSSITITDQGAAISDWEWPYIGLAVDSASGTATISFEEGSAEATPPATNVTTATIDLVDESTGYVKEPISTITCFNGPTPVACSGAGGGATQAVLNVSGLTSGDVYLLYVNEDDVDPPLQSTYGFSEPSGPRASATAT